ncbi:MAG: putative membrane protein [Kiritimatiellia bacterium]|jgi:uncharacterized membrane protein
MIKFLFQRLRTVLLAGLLVTLPLAVTIWVIVTLVAFVDSVVAWIPKLVPHDYFAWVMSFYPALMPLSPEGLPQGLGILVTLTTLLFVGIIARSYIGVRFIRMYEVLLSRVPMVSSIYQAIKELLELVFSTDGNAFEKVVLVEWPRPGLFSVGFLNGESYVQIEGRARMVNVFLPTTPNPTTGFFAMIPEDQVFETEMSIEQGFKILMSAGIVAPPGKVTVRRHALSPLECFEPALVPEDEPAPGGSVDDA